MSASGAMATGIESGMMEFFGVMISAEFVVVLENIDDYVKNVVVIRDSLD